jgi:hypothetical protein
MSFGKKRGSLDKTSGDERGAMHRCKVDIEYPDTIVSTSKN